MSCSSKYAEDELLPLSGLQHMAFCERQWALIHIEQQWEENLRTAEGRVIHERVHDPEYKAHKPGVVVVRGMKLQSLSLGLSGVADIIEYLPTDDTGGIHLINRPGFYMPIPVEYKRGKTKQGDYDRIQLCAQAMCLEEMTGCQIPEGYLYYAETRRRELVKLDTVLRGRVQTLSEKMHHLFRSGITPKPDVKLTVCRQCSLENVCLPRMRLKISGQAYWKEILDSIHTADE